MVPHSTSRERQGHFNLLPRNDVAILDFVNCLKSLRTVFLYSKDWMRGGINSVFFFSNADKLKHSFVTMQLKSFQTMWQRCL